MNSSNSDEPTPSENILVGGEYKNLRLLFAIAGLGITQIIGWGTIFYPPAVIAEEMGRDIGLDRESVFFGITVAMLVGAVTSSKIGTLIDRHGARIPLVVGCLVTALALFLLSISTHPPVFWISWGILGIASPLVLSTGCYAAMVQIAGKHARKAVSALTLFSGFASTIFYPATHFLDEFQGWRMAYVVFAVLHIVLCLPIYLLVLSSFHKKGAISKDAVPAAITGTRAIFAFWLFAALVMTNTLVSAGLTLHLISIFGMLGLSAGMAVSAASFTGPSQVGGRVIEIILGDHYPPIATALVAAFLQVMAFVLILSGRPEAMIWIFVCIYGLSNGLMAIVRASIPLEFFGTLKYGTIMGRLNIAFSITNAVAPVIFASFFKHFGAIRLLTLCCGLAIFSGAIVVSLFYIWCKTSSKNPFNK
jgi:MFS family permease